MSGKIRQFYDFGEFRLDATDYLLTRKRTGEPVALKPKVVETLLLFTRAPGRIIGKNELMDALWGETAVEEANLTQNIYLLRKALGTQDGGKPFIETVPKRGYRFSAPVAELNEAPHSLSDEESLSNADASELAERSEDGNSFGFAEMLPAAQSPEASADANFELRVAASGDVFAGAAAEKSPLEKSKIKLSSFRYATLALVILASFGVVAVYNINFGGRSTAEKDRNSVTATSTFERVSFKKVLGSDGGYSPALSPDGKTAAYRDSNNLLWLENLATGARAPITDGAQQIKGEWLKFSPDGNYLYYTLRPDGEAHDALFQVAVPGGVPRQIVGNVWTGAAVSPDGKQIAFMRFDVGADEIGLFAVKTDDPSSERRIATHHQPNFFALYGNYLAWSPDGGKIACIGGAPDYKSGDPGHILVINVADGSEFSVLNPDGWQVSDIDELSWLPDGGGLLVVARDSRMSPYQIWKVTYPEGAWRRITNDLNSYSKVDVSADGKSLITAQVKTYSHLWQQTLAANGKQKGSARQLTFGQTYKDGSIGLNFTPDGKKIVYASSENGAYEIWTASADGSNRKQLTFGNESAAYPVVTPDNRYIVFVNMTGGIPHLRRVNADGSDAVQLTSGAAGEWYQPAVTFDGGAVIYTSLNSKIKKTALQRVSISGGEATELTDKFGGWMPTISPDGKWLAYNFYNYEAVPSWQMGIMPSAGGEPVKTFEMPPSGIAVWSADGQSLLYLDKEKMNILQKTAFADGVPRQITDFKSEQIHNFALSRDGKQLLVARGSTETNIIVIESNQ